MAKTLIAYFSRRDENYVGISKEVLKVGNTETVVGKIRELIEADTFEISMKRPYFKGYEECMRESRADLDSNARPELNSLPETIEPYENVILAYPNYWDTMPMAVFTFLEAFDFAGKTILPVCTNEGGDLGHSLDDIRRTCRGAKLREGLSLAGCGVASSGPFIERWLKANGLIR